MAGRQPAETAWWQGTVRMHSGMVDAFAACGVARKLPGGLAGPIGAAFRRVLDLPSGVGPAAVLEGQARVAALLAAVARVLGLEEGGPDVAALAPVVRFVEANLHLPLSRRELAARVGLAPSRFHEIFLAATGLPPMAWVRRRRLETAAGLLAGSTLGMADIAQRVGMCDAYHLNKRFRAAYGMPPTRFRRQVGG
ncbi:MAG: helix-turn-helix transcriptional regulator [Planctomycetes bacterium]|nr:helix-turn-helix transcriptional regulator [Planctomycetota bacterium]